MGSSQSTDKAMDSLQRAYADQLPDKLREAEGLYEALRRSPDDVESLRRLIRLTHNLAGSGSTFGFPALGASALDLSDALQALLDGNDSKLAGHFPRLDGLVETLKRSLNDIHALSPRPASSPRIDVVPAAPTECRLIYLVEDDVQLAQSLALQISSFGYTVRRFSELPGLLESVQKDPPAAILMDIIFPEGNLAGTETIKQIRATVDRKNIPVIFISVRDDLLARLEAVRAGGEAYFTKPLDVGEIMDTLDRLILSEPADPYHILIVEDDLDQASRYALVLRERGMRTSVVTNPLLVMQPLVNFQPDLILMDLGMPSCSGIELARVIRQQSAYVGVPIVFLTVEGNPNVRNTALRLGADDYLTKPLPDDQLAEVIAARVERARALRAFTVRDGLTGLLNHSAIQDRLIDEVSRARRQGTPLAWILFNLDYFKSVNDTYGYTAGDRVLRSFARLLRKRLRRTDSIGRYGGDAFAAVLPGAEGARAAALADALRDGFARIRQRSFHEEFGVTVSGGLASLAPGRDARSLADAAEQALQQAKATGRNRVVAAGG